MQTIDTVTTPAKDVPLCVDLDGTLVKSDLLIDACLVTVRRRPELLLRMPFWLLRGKAGFKAALAKEIQLSPSGLPYNEELLQYLRDEHARGRKLHLATGANDQIASGVARHLGIFESVICSDDRRNLTGYSKLHVLNERFGEGGFDYIGNSNQDLPILENANKAMLANASWATSAKARLKNIAVEREFNHRKNTMVAILSAIRARQWPKNLLIFLPLFLSHEFGDRSKLINSFLAFVAFSFVASAGYILNDMLDMEADRQHPRKRKRPFAAGDLSPVAGLIVAAVLLCAAGVYSSTQPAKFAYMLCAYLVGTISYSFLLKKIAILDVLVLAGLYTIRIICGSVVTSVPLSTWFESFSLFFFLSLAIVKRYEELQGLRERHALPANDRGYRVDDIEQLRSFGTASAYAAVVIFVLYVSSPDVQRLYHHPQALWAIVPVLVYWINRVWLLAHRGEMHEDPVVFALTDRVSIWIGAFSAIILILGAR
ncbi:MAG TPA: UbiA family prenyltransferase [Terriglobales bacterium]|nr:UbiA family prenyltransferase [Terriglobales bacterium]